MALKSSGARAQKRNKTKSLFKFKSRGHTGVIIRCRGRRLFKVEKCSSQYVPLYLKVLITICAPLLITCDNEIKGTCGIKNVILRSAPSALVSALLNHTHVIIRRNNKIIPFDMQTWINPAKIHKFNKTSIHLRCGAGYE